MKPYSGCYAGLYDIFYRDKRYKEEAAFVHQCLQSFNSGKTRRLLELACGTGEHAFAFQTLGYEVAGVDYSDDMLVYARRKANRKALSVSFHLQDISNLNIPYRAFDAATCLFDSIGYVVTDEALIRTLRAVHGHLREKGLFIFEFWHAEAMLRNYEPLRIRRWATPEGEILRISETSLKRSKQLGIVTYTVYELRKNGTYSSFSETHINRYFPVQEIAGWLACSGFDLLKCFAGFTPNEEITDKTWHVVAVAQKKGKSG